MFKNILKIAGIVLIVALFFGCEEDTDEMSVIERIAAFEDSLNEGDYDNLTKHFHPDMPSYDTYQDGSVLESGSLGSANYPFDFSTPSVSDSGSNKNATGTVTSNNGAAWDNAPYTAVMKEDGDNNWKIYSLVVDGATIAEGLSR